MKKITRKPHDVLRESVNTCLDEFGRVTAPEVLDFALSHYHTELRAAQEQAMRQGFLRQIKQLLKAVAETDGVDTEEPAQLSLPGFLAPIALPVQSESGEYIYINFRKMTWPDLVGALNHRDTNLDRARKRRRDLRQKMDYLRPYMSEDFNVTVEEAARLAESEQAA